MANEYSLIEDLLRRIRAGQFNEPTQMGSMVGMRAQPNFNIPPEAYTESRNQKFSERAAPLDIQPPQYEEDIPMPPRRPAEFGARPVVRAPMPVPRPAEAAPSMPENVSRALWAVYNETGNPADFERANVAQRMGRAEGGFISEGEQNAQLNDAVTYAKNLARQEAMGEAKQALGETWPVKVGKMVYELPGHMVDMARSAVTAPRDAYEGKLNPYSEEGIKRAIDMAGMVMTGGVGGAPAGAIGSGPIRSVSPEDAMMLVHNLKSSRLADVEKLGGLPVPSTAIIKPEQGFTAFGDITMVAPKEMAKPSITNPIFGADVYSPRFPSLNDEGTKIFKGRSPSGTRQYAPLTLENVVKEMKGNIRGGEGFNYGAGTIRAGVAPQFTSIEQMQAARGQIMPRKNMQSAFNEANERLNTLSEKYYPHYQYGGDQWTHQKDLSDMLRLAGMGKWSELQSTYKPSLPPEVRGETIDFLNYLKQLPTEYFEGKPQRAVRLNEFRGAVVPGNLPGEQADILRRMGVERLQEYDPNSAVSRIEALRKFSGEQFASGGPVHGYATDGYVDPMGAAYEPAGEAPAPDWYNKAADAAARATSAVAEPFMSGTAESAREGLDLMRGEPGRAPINAAWQYPLGVAGFLTSPIMGAGRAVKDVATELSGSPEIGARAGFMTEMGNPAKIGPALAAVAPMASRAAEAARATQIARELSPLGFYSHGAEAAAALPQAKGTPEQYAAMLQKAGVKPAELEHTGFQQAFAGRPSVTREEIAKHFQEKMPQVEETVLGYNSKAHALEQKKEEISRQLDTIVERESAAGRTPADSPDYKELEKEYYNITDNLMPQESATKFQQYALPGGENYREVLLRTDLNPPPISESKYYDLSDKAAVSPLSEAEKAQIQAYTRWKNASDRPSVQDYRSSHWDDPNVLAHLRMADRTGPNGEKVLHIEEIQSDWGQAGRKEGFKGQKPENPGNFATWGRERGMSPEEIKASFNKESSPEFQEWSGANEKFRNDLAAYERGVPSAPYVTSTQGWTDLALKRALREAAEGGYDKMVWTPGAEQAKRYPGTSEAGMVGYYDKMVPTRMKELLKKLDKDVKLGVSEVNGIQVPSIQITPAMREKILSGQTAFATGGAVVERALGVVSQSKPGRR